VKLPVTGGADYIGSVVAPRLLKTGHEIMALDDLSRGHEACDRSGDRHCGERIRHGSPEFQDC
jgi:UDP-glucose 4-epimerase